MTNFSIVFQLRESELGIDILKKGETALMEKTKEALNDFNDVLADPNVNSEKTQKMLHVLLEFGDDLCEFRAHVEQEREKEPPQNVSQNVNVGTFENSEKENISRSMTDSHNPLRNYFKAKIEKEKAKTDKSIQTSFPFKHMSTQTELLVFINQN